MKKLIWVLFFVFMIALAEAVVDDKTNNKPAVSGQRVIQGEELRSGNYIAMDGKKISLVKQADNKIMLRAENSFADTNLDISSEMIQNRARLKVKLSNGRNAEIKIMPDVASARALERLRIKVCNESNNCTIQLKEVGTGDRTKMSYEVHAVKKTRVLGLFKVRMNIESQIDAETGAVLEAKKPWWSFLASENEE